MRRDVCKWCKVREPEHERSLCTPCLDKRAEARARNPNRRASLVAMYRARGTLYGYPTKKDTET